MLYPLRPRGGDRLGGAGRFAAAAFLGSGLGTEPSAATLRRKASMRLITLRAGGFVGVSLLGNSARFLFLSMETSAVLYRSSNHAASKSPVFVLMMCSASRNSSSGRS